MNIIILAPLLAGVWLIGMALITKTTTFSASLIFKVIPFFLGLGCLYTGLKMLGAI